MNPVTFERSLRESKYSGWIEQFSQMMLNVNTSSSNAGGRPSSDSSELTESAEGSRDTSYDGG